MSSETYLAVEDDVRHAVEMTLPSLILMSLRTLRFVLARILEMQNVMRDEGPRVQLRCRNVVSLDAKTPDEECPINSILPRHPVPWVRLSYEVSVIKAEADGLGDSDCYDADPGKSSSVTSISVFISISSTPAPPPSWGS
ncbi:hypothetical protein C8R45DRAFT_1115409 [Mycena sanguinolenta]|nr:hypothetical protein C8R45DRAFT_1115409 [Mycena sanguinolenta]